MTMETATRKTSGEVFLKTRKANADYNKAHTPKKLSRTMEAALKMKGAIEVNDVTLFFR